VKDVKINFKYFEESNLLGRLYKFIVGIVRDVTIYLFFGIYDANFRTFTRIYLTKPN
jgi:hypothetical protein